LNQIQHDVVDPRNLTLRLCPAGSPMAGPTLVPHHYPGRPALAARNFLRAGPGFVIKKFRPGMPDLPGWCSGGSLGRVLFKENAEKETGWEYEWRPGNARLLSSLWATIPAMISKGWTMREATLEQVRSLILLVRGQKVILDSDLAELYEVETKALNRAVKRNAERFPADF
jgi:hypothetical protein